MELEDTIPFSSMIAGMLLLTNHVSSIDVINLMARLSKKGISVDDETDDIFKLVCCIDTDKYCSFSLRSGFDYHTKLMNGDTVSQYLEKVAGNMVLEYLKNDSVYGVLYSEYLKRLLLESDFSFDTSSFISNKVRSKRLKPMVSFLSEFLF